MMLILAKEEREVVVLKARREGARGRRRRVNISGIGGLELVERRLSCNGREELDKWMD